MDQNEDDMFLYGIRKLSEEVCIDPNEKNPKKRNFMS